MTEIKDFINNLKIDKFVTYGNQIAKVDELCRGNKKGKLVLVSSMSPTKKGNGKTTISIGLADAINKAGKCCILSLREPSMGPVFGMKGGATGGGKCSLDAADQINLHFTGDFHAITSANNLICACVDNSVYQGNPLRIDINKILINRCLDVNDRALRAVVVGDKNNRRTEHFVITPASEIMAILCLSKNFAELKKNIAKIMVALDLDGNPIYVDDLKITNAVCSLLISAINPNLVPTLEGTPAFVHGGPFANIAHGASSIIATQMALSYADYAVTEAGFGADLGAEKFFDVVCPKLKKYPDCVVLVATIDAILTNGYGDLGSGMCNLKRHITNIRDKFGANVVVAVNKFAGDSDKDINSVISFCKSMGVSACKCSAYQDGASGAAELAELVMAASGEPCKPHSLYSSSLSPEEKIVAIAKNIYGAGSVKFLEPAKDKLKFIASHGYQNLPVVISKTQYSFSEDENALSAPENFELTIRDIELKSGAGFVLALCGKQLLMPALPKEPNATKVVLKGKTIQKLQ